MSEDRIRPCGCIVCVCEDTEQCHGCGAKHCGTHPLGEIPNPAYTPMTPHALTRELSLATIEEAIQRAELCASVEWPGDFARQILFLAQQTFTPAHDDEYRKRGIELRDLRQTLAQQAQELQRQNSLLQLLHFIVEHDGEFDNPETIKAEAETYGLENVLELKQQAQEVAEFKDLLNRREDLVCELTGQLAAMTSERDEWKNRCEDKWDANTKLRREIEKLREDFNCEVNASISQGKQLAASQQQYNELTKEGGELHSLQISNAQLQATLAERERRIAELDKLLSGELDVGRIEFSPETGLNLQVSHPLMAVVTAAMVNFFHDAGGLNYVEMSVVHKTEGPFLLTVQKNSLAKTPHQFRIEAESERDTARQDAARLREALLTIHDARSQWRIGKITNDEYFNRIADGLREGA